MTIGKRVGLPGAGQGHRRFHAHRAGAGDPGDGDRLRVASARSMCRSPTPSAPTRTSRPSAQLAQGCAEHVLATRRNLGFTSAAIAATMCDGLPSVPAVPAYTRTVAPSATHVGGVATASPQPGHARRDVTVTVSRGAINTPIQLPLVQQLAAEIAHGAKLDLTLIEAVVAIVALGLLTVASMPMLENALNAYTATNNSVAILGKLRSCHRAHGPRAARGAPQRRELRSQYESDRPGVHAGRRGDDPDRHHRPGWRGGYGLTTTRRSSIRCRC
ncbi:MAG: hypothetical protein MZV65_20420 [Chromatiales bacterium]|nr:hypothetical protein [Chromatiales bacterium]